MPKQALMYTNELQIGKPTRSDDNFQHYMAIIASMKRNTKSFRWSAETLNSMIRQLNAGNGIGIYPLHNYFGEFPIGRTVSSKLVKNQALTEIYIQKGLTMGRNGQKSDELIERMNALTVDSFSTGTLGGDFLCDIDKTKFEYKSNGEYYYTRLCEKGHRLGEILQANGKEKEVTATVYGEVRIYEVSVVGNPAIPDAKTVKMLQDDLSCGDILSADIPVICELNNYFLDGLCDTLGMKLDAPKPAPKTEPYIIKGDNNMDPELLERERKQLEKDNESLTTQVETLTNDLKATQEDSFTKEEYEAMVKERNDLKTERDALKDAEPDAEKDELAEIGRTAINWAKGFYVEAEVSANQLDADGEAEVKEYVSDKMDFLTLVRTARANLKKSYKNRSGGKKSAHYAEKPKTVEDGWFPASVNQI